MTRKPTTRKARTQNASSSPGASTLDAGDEGMPFIAADAKAATIGGEGNEALPAGEDLIVEVEMAPHAAAVGNALAANTAGFLTDIAGVAQPDTGLRGLLRQYQLRDARAVFSGAQVLAEQQRLDALRAAVASGSASSEQLGAVEHLPALSSFVRLRFPPGTPPAEVTDTLQHLPGGQQGSRRPQGETAGIGAAPGRPPDRGRLAQDGRRQRPRYPMVSPSHASATGVAVLARGKRGDRRHRLGLPHFSPGTARRDRTHLQRRRRRLGRRAGAVVGPRNRGIGDRRSQGRRR